jgi:hypothetical protein
MTTVTKVYSADPLVMAEQCRHAAVRTAVADLAAGTSYKVVLYNLTRSVLRCSHLDNRPLDAGRVFARAKVTEAKCRRW